MGREVGAKRRTRIEWIAAALEAMADGGVDAVRVERLAPTLGVSKGSFYWHFEDRNDLLTATVDQWEAGGTDRIIARAEAGGGDAAARILALGRLTADPKRMASELAIRDWARRDPAIAARVERVDDRRMQYLRALFTQLGAPTGEIEARAMLLSSLLTGNYFIRAKHGRRSRRTVLAQAVALLLETKC